MIKILFHRISIVLFWVLTLNVNAQTDTVCVNQTSHYWFFGGVNSTYEWIIQGGTILNGQGNDTVKIQWGIIPGNYQLKLIETNSSGCKSDTNRLNIVILPNSPISISGPTEICAGETISLFAINTISRHWNTGEQTETISVHPGSTIQYQLIGKNLCATDTLTHLLTVYPLPVPDFSYFPQEPYQGESIQLTYTGTPVNNWNWYDSKTLFSNLQNPDYFLNKTSQIKLFVTDIHGCSDSIQKTIRIYNQINIWVPTAFSPNGDGLNDIFKPECKTEIQDFEFYIYNRWGELIFSSKNPDFGWDGTYQGSKVPSATYTWIIKYNLSQNDLQPAGVVEQGSVTVIY